MEMSEFDFARVLDFLGKGTVNGTVNWMVDTSGGTADFPLEDDRILRVVVRADSWGVEVQTVIGVYRPELMPEYRRQLVAQGGPPDLFVNKDDTLGHTNFGGVVVKEGNAAPSEAAAMQRLYHMVQRRIVNWQMRPVAEAWTAVLQKETWR